MSDIQIITETAPATPAATNIIIYSDATSKNLCAINDAGIINHGVQTLPLTNNNFIQGLNDDGSWISTAFGAAQLDFLTVHGADIASAATTAIFSSTGYFVHITGTTTITNFSAGTADGLYRVLRFTGALTLTNNGNIILPGGANITTVAGDMAIFVGDGGAARCVSYSPVTVQGAGAAVKATSPTLTTPVIGAATGTSLAVTGALTSSSATSGLGAATGAGGTVSQLTSKSTGVTLSKICGQITMFNTSMLTLGIAGFTLTNTSISTTDCVIVWIVSGGTVNSYNVVVDAVAGGSCHISIQNISVGTLSEAVVVGFMVIKAVTA